MSGLISSISAKTAPLFFTVLIPLMFLLYIVYYLSLVLLSPCLDYVCPTTNLGCFSVWISFCFWSDFLLPSFSLSWIWQRVNFLFSHHFRSVYLLWYLLFILIFWWGFCFCYALGVGFLEIRWLEIKPSILLIVLTICHYVWLTWFLILVFGFHLRLAFVKFRSFHFSLADVRHHSNRVWGLWFHFYWSRRAHIF